MLDIKQLGLDTILELHCVSTFYWTILIFVNIPHDHCIPIKNYLRAVKIFNKDLGPTDLIVDQNTKP